MLTINTNKFNVTKHRTRITAKEKRTIRNVEIIWYSLI